MSLTVATCRCGRRWYRFGRAEWDKHRELAECPGCGSGPWLVKGWHRLTSE